MASRCGAPCSLLVMCVCFDGPSAAARGSDSWKPKSTLKLVNESDLFFVKSPVKGHPACLTVCCAAAVSHTQTLYTWRDSQTTASSLLLYTTVDQYCCTYCCTPQNPPVRPSKAAIWYFVYMYCVYFNQETACSLPVEQQHHYDRQIEEEKGRCCCLRIFHIHIHAQDVFVHLIITDLPLQNVDPCLLPFGPWPPRIPCMLPFLRCSIMMPIHSASRSGLNSYAFFVLATSTSRTPDAPHRRHSGQVFIYGRVCSNLPEEACWTTAVHENIR